MKKIIHKIFGCSFFWKTHHIAGIHVYEECTFCSKRDFRNIIGPRGVGVPPSFVYTPIDREWLTRGEVKNLSDIPPTDSGSVT